MLSFVLNLSKRWLEMIETLFSNPCNQSGVWIGVLGKIFCEYFASRINKTSPAASLAQLFKKHYLHRYISRSFNSADLMTLLNSESRL